MRVLAELVRAAAGGRARPGPPPSRERLDLLAREIREGDYRVVPEQVASAMLIRGDRRAPRG